MKKFIPDLSKEQQKQLSCELQILLANNAEIVCLVADRYDVDRNETVDLYIYLQKKFCDKNDFNKKDLHFVKHATEAVKKLILKKRGE